MRSTSLLLLAAVFLTLGLRSARRRWRIARGGGKTDALIATPMDELGCIAANQVAEESQVGDMRDLCERHFQASAMARSRCGPLARRNSRMLALIRWAWRAPFMVFPERQNRTEVRGFPGVNQGSLYSFLFRLLGDISFRVAVLAAATLASIVAWPASPDGSSSRKRNRPGPVPT